MKTLQFITIIILFPSLLFAEIESSKDNTIAIDLGNKAHTNRVVVEPDNITLYKNDSDKNPSLLHEFKYGPTNIYGFNQYDLINGRLERIFGQYITSAINVDSTADNIRYASLQSTFSKDKFIIADINRDGLLDFVKIEEPSSNNGGYYTHLIFYQSIDGTFSDTANKVIKEKGSSWISGIYYDFNGDGVPEKIEIKYKHFGVLLANTKCTVNIYFLNNKTNEYKNTPDLHVISTGLFYENNNFTDINNDGYPDIFIVDIPKKPRSIESVISKILDKRIDIDIKFYIYKKGTGDYPPIPSFVKKINIDILQEFTISFDDNDAPGAYKNLIITQANQSEKYKLP